MDESKKYVYITKCGQILIYSIKTAQNIAIQHLKQLMSKWIIKFEKLTWSKVHIIQRWNERLLYVEYKMKQEITAL